MTLEQVAKASGDIFISPPAKSLSGEPLYSIYFVDADGLGMTRWSNHWGPHGSETHPSSLSSLEGVVGREKFGMTEMRMGHVYFRDIRHL